MGNTNGRLTVALLAVSESSASTLYGMHELLGSAGRDWDLVTTGTPGVSPIRPAIVSGDGRRVQLPSGLSIEPECALADCPRPEVVAVPDLMVDPQDDISGRYEREVRWLGKLYAQGSTVTAACSGVLVIAEAGLLDGQDATTHWAYCEAMAMRYPAVRVHANRPLVVSGEDQRLVMAGGGTSWYDLALFLIARFVGTEEAMRVARLHLLDWHHIGQLPYASLTCARQADDALIAKCQEWIAVHYDRDSPVTEMARLSGLPERSFKRRFVRATGMSPLEYVHTLRLEESKHLLETTVASVEAVANDVGYEDASFFGRLFRRKVGLTPAQYRRRFAALHRALEQEGGRDRAGEVG
ncbi:MAG: helix-turn-helix domain-containing protein [Gammaproteobacteria bacterium]|nr:helix-turn-helix domain-containing protein [Gammaproteobacteria bacterium]NIR31782.1 helix-turn-helix domain-containing protein [Gammaproteobacteria bacterium]NIR98713.1 helix-turn-helix domain-containing protein [Gammaproteobacteria bacterium]NIT64430.1 helix-turn-helix domain-containing protein [Gammaproteobacteria bacterium]NIV20845.1 helix-turn-helix domain-containing protein [Gammaproteobacteria bacterium]